MVLLAQNVDLQVFPVVRVVAKVADVEVFLALGQLLPIAVPHIERQCLQQFATQVKPVQFGRRATVAVRPEGAVGGMGQAGAFLYLLVQPRYALQLILKIRLLETAAPVRPAATEKCLKVDVSSEDFVEQKSLGVRELRS